MKDVDEGGNKGVRYQGRWVAILRRGSAVNARVQKARLTPQEQDGIVDYNCRKIGYNSIDISRKLLYN